MSENNNIEWVLEASSNICIPWIAKPKNHEDKMSNPNKTEEIATGIAMKHNLHEGETRPYKRQIIEAMQEHTAQTLDRLKGKVEERVEYLQHIIEEDNHSNEYLAVKESRMDEDKRIIKLIEEVSDE